VSQPAAEIRRDPSSGLLPERAVARRRSGYCAHRRAPARRIVSALLDQNVLISDSTRAPLRLAFPAALAPRWMPGLFPDRTGWRPKRPRDPAQLATLIGVARLAHPPRW